MKVVYCEVVEGKGRRRERESRMGEVTQDFSLINAFAYSLFSRTWKISETN